MHLSSGELKYTKVSFTEMLVDGRADGHRHEDVTVGHVAFVTSKLLFAVYPRKNVGRSGNF